MKRRDSLLPRKLYARVDVLQYPTQKRPMIEHLRSATDTNERFGGYRG